MPPARLLSKKEHGKFEIILIKNSVLLEPALKKRQTQPANYKLTMETLEQGVKYV